MSFFSTSRVLAVGALFTFAAIGSAQQAISFSSMSSIDAPGDASNQVGVRTSISSTYTLGSFISLVSGTLTKVNADTYASEARIRIRSNRYPTDYADVPPFNVDSYTGSINLTPGELRPLVGSLVGKSILPGDVLSFEFYESYDDDFNLPESNWTNLTFTLNRLEPPTPEDLGVLGLGTFS